MNWLRKPHDFFYSEYRVLQKVKLNRSDQDIVSGLSPKLPIPVSSRLHQLSLTKEHSLFSSASSAFIHTQLISFRLLTLSGQLSNT